MEYGGSQQIVGSELPPSLKLRRTRAPRHARGLELACGELVEPVETARDLSSVLSAIASATAEGLAKEDSEVRIARERASYGRSPCGIVNEV
jgi:hypothetical protein